MRNGISPIIIDNTNLHAWEMKPYAVMVGRRIILNFQLWAFCEKVETFVLFFPISVITFINSNPLREREVLFSCFFSVQWPRFAEIVISGYNF